MTKTIVVPLDGSPLAERALPTAAWLARSLPAHVRLVQTTFAADTTAAEAYLQDQGASVGLEDVVVDLVHMSFPGAGIIRAADESPDPALCMTTRGKGGLAEILLGSVSDEVLRGVRAPVVLVGPSCVVGDLPSRSLVVSVDGSEGARTIYPVVAEWTEKLGLDVHVVAVAEGRDTPTTDPRTVAAHEIVDEAVAHLAELGVAAHPQVISGADAAEVVVAFAAGLPAALIAVGAHGRHGWSAAALSRVTADIVRHATCPVLVQRALD